MKEFFTNTPLGVALYSILCITLLILFESNTIFSALLLFLFFISIVLMLNNYVILSLVFIRPMSKKYKIKASDLTKYENIRYITVAIFIALILFFFMAVFNIHIYVFTLGLSVFFIQSIYLVMKYKNYTILHYIDHFSPDLFNWYKVYRLSIDDDLKKKCFQIYNIDIDYYKKLFEQYKELEIQQKIFEVKQMRLEFKKNTKDYCCTKELNEL